MEAYLYSFSGIDELAGACKFIMSLNLPSQTSVYCEYCGINTRYYLIFSQIVYDIRSDLYPMCAISEFAESEIRMTRAVRAYLNERCELIAENNAAEIFSAFC